MGDQNNTFPNQGSPLNGVGFPIVAPLFFRPKFDEEDAIDHTTYLGTPVYSNLVFLSDADVPGYENKKFVIDTVLFSVVQTKNIVKTPIAGRDNGTIKEYISKGDYMVSIDGLLVGELNDFAPKDLVVALKSFLDLPKSINIVSDYLNLFSIASLCVESYQISEVLGFRNQYQFSIQALSDFPIEIKVATKYLG